MNPFRRNQKGKNKMKEETSHDANAMNVNDLTTSLKEITKRVKHLTKELAKSGLPRSVNPPSSNPMEWTDLLYSWVTLLDIDIPLAKQERDDCWAYALATGHLYCIMLSKLEHNMLYHDTLVHIVPQMYQNSLGGIDTLESVKDFLVKNEYVKDMIVHRRPSEYFEEYETLIQDLLRKSPVVVSFDRLPSYLSYNGKDIYIPQVMECQTTFYELYERHSVVIMGCGAKLVEGKWIEFWEYQNSLGKKWGVKGFGKLARRMGLVREAVEFKL